MTLSPWGGPASPATGCEQVPDGELVAMCLGAGRAYDAAFAELYARHAPRVFGFLLKVTGRREAAEDALQETFLRVYKSLERFDGRRDLATWMLQIARYVAIDAWRVEQKVKRLEAARGSELGAVEPDAAEAGAVRSEAAELVDAVMEELSLDDRSLLLLRHHQGLTFRSIGEVCDCSARTAQNRVEAAARRFQQALNRRTAEKGGGPA